MSDRVTDALQRAHLALSASHNLTVTDRPDLPREAWPVWVTDHRAEISALDEAIMRKTHYTCRELAGFKLHDLPGSEMGWSKLVKREGWPFREVPVKGGKGGVAREYAPPPHIAKLIDRASAVGSGSANRKTAAKLVTLTLTLPASEAAALLQWLNGRGDHA